MVARMAWQPVVLCLEIAADPAETVPDTRLAYVADREGDLRALINDARRVEPALGSTRRDGIRNDTDLRYPATVNLFDTQPEGR